MATHLPVIGGHAEGFGKTTRTDDWRSGPAITFAVFATFVVYTTWAALQGNHYYVDPYLSPFYSPVLFSDPHVAGAAHGRTSPRAKRSRSSTSRSRTGAKAITSMPPRRAAACARTATRAV